MSGWRSVVDQILALDPDDEEPADLSDAELLSTAEDLQTAINKLTARQARVVRTADVREVYRDDGMGSMKSWLTGHCRLSGRDAAGLVRAGRRLEELPEVEAAFAAGELTAAHVAVVTAAVTPTRVDSAERHGISLAETDRVLAGAARQLGPEDTAKAVRRWVAGVDPDGALADAADVDRRFTMAVSLAGRVHLGGHLDPVGAETVHAALGALMNGDRPPGDLRSHAERQGEALVELCRRALVTGDLPEVRGERPQVRVVIDWQSLSAACDAAGVAGGELPFAGPITAETARRLACDANVVRVITGPDGLPLDTGRAQRTATAAIRRAVELRDGHCVFAGCTAPAAWCDVHHVIHWAYGGPTSCDNSALVCERHHTSVHEGGFRLRRHPGTAVWHTYRPDGSEIRPRGPCPVGAG
ncbi:MAG TPA: DUF222 domain-containing protein [Blastococcus sp.]